MDLSILSAENYYDPKLASGARAPNNRTYPTQYYGGIIVREEEEHNQSGVLGVVDTASEEVTPPKKARRVSHGSDDDSSGRKQRGRPRVDPKDETAADRRRTQIRLAQRAYRLRKESTISSLTKRVSELEHTVDQMNTTFLTFRDHAMASGIMDNKPQLVQELTRTTERLLSLAQMAVAQSDHEDNQTSEIQSQKEKSPKSDTTKSRKRTKRDWSSQNSSSGTSSLLVEVTLPQNNRDEIGHGVESTPLQANDDVQRYMGSDCSTEEHTQSSDVNWDAVMQQSRLESHGGTNQMRSPSPTRDSSLHTPFTYSFQESSFARRLQRASIERAYYILNNPNLAPEDLSRIFKFTFFYTNANAITGRLRQLLTRSSSESLDNWTAPLKHLGGAGTHYPRLEANGSKALSPNMRAVGPQLLMPQTPRPENATTEQLLRLTGWDGEWFDSNDVEQYLRTEKGLRLDGHSTFAEVEMPISSLSPAASSNQRSLTNSSSDNGKERKAFNESLSSSRLVSQSHNYFSTSSDAFNQLNETGVGTDMNAGLPDSENDGTDPMGYPFGYNSPAWQDLRPRNPRPTLTIDVSKLLGSLVQGGVCLGRSPGFRRADVDAAFYSTMQEAF